MKQPEEDQVILVDKGIDTVALEQDRMRRITPNQAPVSPNGNEPARVALRGPRKPFTILAPFAAAIDERTCKNIVILHPNSQAATDRGAQFTGIRLEPFNCRRSS
jgi:hypothetical protein